MEPKYITLEQAKWLKEKGFNIPTIYYWFENSKVSVPTRTSDNQYSNWNQFLSNLRISAPEQHQVVDWLLSNHDIWIEVRHIKTFGVNRFHIIIWKYGKEDYHTIHCGNSVGYEVWDTPQEAYSAAFDYIKNNNLI